MLLFIVCVCLLIGGYFIYGKVVESAFGVERSRVSPSASLSDGIDFVPMPLWKAFLIQLLNIAGIGPIFGPILGALYGPQALLWVVFGSIFAGGVHDFASGFLSVRSDGQSVPELVGDALGVPARYVMRFFSLLLLLLVGVVFVISPAHLLSGLTGWSTPAFVLAIFVYYFLATVMPIHTVIGRIYPVFGALLIFMSFSIISGLFAGGYEFLPNTDFLVNTHPLKRPIWPVLFVVLSCGALSGFHSTQSPMMARCIRNEGNSRFVFYGAMIAEGIIALIWVTVGLSFYKSPEALNAVIIKGSPSAVVHDAATTLLGHAGGILAILGVIILPITSGDTAFRSARLILAETFRMEQGSMLKRLLLAMPLFALGYIVSQLDFDLIWRYFGWANQMLAMLVLWTAAIWLARNGRAKYHWLASVPATFISAVSVAFILGSPIGFRMPYGTSSAAGIVVALAVFGFFLFRLRRWVR